MGVGPMKLTVNTCDSKSFQRATTFDNKSVIGMAELDTYAVTFKKIRFQCRAITTYLFPISHMSCEERQPLTDRSLVCRMDVISIAYIY